MYIRNLVGSKSPGEYNQSRLGDMPGKLGGLVGYEDKRLGPQIYRIIQVVESGGMGAGELVARAAAVSTTAEATSTTRSWDHAATFTADVHQNDLLCVLDSAAAAGAPEGQVRKIGLNTAGSLKLAQDEDPFTVTIGVGDTAIVKRMWKGDDAADSDAMAEILGVLPGDVTTKYFALALCWGLCDFALVKAAIGVNEPVVADATYIGPFGTDSITLQLGYCYATAYATAVSAGTDVGGLQFIDVLNRIGINED